MNLQDEIEINIGVAVNPSGDPTSLREREHAAQFLLTHAEVSYSRIMDLVQEKPESWQAPRLIELIGFFKKEESIPLLKNILLKGLPEASRAAGRALGFIPKPIAYSALKEGIQSTISEVRIGAIEGIRISLDKSWCQVIETLFVDKDANFRYYVINAAAELGCINNERLKTIAKQDKDFYIRQLSFEWLKKSYK